MSVPTLAYPGLLLGPSTKYSSGHGTHTYDSNIYASLAGPVTTDKATATTSSVLPKLSVTRLSSTHPLPHVNSNVLCRVTRLQTRQVTTEILVVDGQVCQDSWAGVVRKEDVRGWEKDKVVMAESFQVGDLVRAVVVGSIFFYWKIIATRFEKDPLLIT